MDLDGLPVRARKAIINICGRDATIEQIREAADAGWQGLLRYKNFGETSLNHVKRWLKSRENEQQQTPVYAFKEKTGHSKEYWLCEFAGRAMVGCCANTDRAGSFADYAADSVRFSVALVDALAAHLEASRG